MTAKSVKSRLFVEYPLARAQHVPLSAGQSRYLCRVMRLREGGRVTVFNGEDGEWTAELTGRGSRADLTCIRQTRDQMPCPDVWLLMAPLRPARTEFAVEKAVELGVSRIAFVSPRHAVGRKINVNRLRSVAIEAAEQCGGMHVPRIEGDRCLETEFRSWPPDRSLLFCDEKAAADLGFPALPGNAACAVLIGPEGGFAESERQMIGGLEFSVRVSLGNRILRAETAALAALALLNIVRGNAGPKTALAARGQATL